MNVAMAGYSEFEADFLNAHTWGQRKDGPPFYLLDALDSDEKKRAEEELLARLDGRDSWPILGLAHLNCQQAVPQIKSLLWKAEGKGMVIAIAEALFQLTGDRSLEKRIIRMARSRWFTHWSTRIDAIHALAKFKTPASMEALAELVNDPHYLVAYNAKRAPELYPERE